MVGSSLVGLLPPGARCCRLCPDGADQKIAFRGNAGKRRLKVRIEIDIRQGMEEGLHREGSFPGRSLSRI